MTIVMGIDPGSIVTGYGIIRVENQKFEYMDSGCIRMDSSKNIAPRLKQIHDGIAELIAQYQPHEAAIEEVFMATNAGSAIKLGQARGAAITTLMRFNIEPSEYSAREVKKAVVGYGAASKEQVQMMIKTLLNLPRVPVKDAADALAIAICHVNTQKYVKLVDKALQNNPQNFCSGV